jgi:hypothetical protein
VDSFDLALKVKHLSQKEKMFISEQVYCRKKAQQKIPSFYISQCVYTKRALEQCTHEEVSKFKVEIIKGDTLYDLCAGLGVDDYFLSSNFNKVISYDSDNVLNEIVNFNLQKLKAGNVSRITDRAENFDYSTLKKEDVVYLDPDRRDSAGKRQFAIKDHSPDITKLASKAGDKCQMYFKLSPMTDLTSIAKSIQRIKSIYIISYKLENKEILVHTEPGFNGSISIYAVELDSTKKIHHSILGDEPDVIIGGSSTILCIPSPAIIKSGSSNSLAKRYSMTKLNGEGHILFTNEEFSDFPGRQFKVLYEAEYKPKQIKSYLKDQSIKKANIISRQFFHKPSELLKSLKLKEGGEDYLIFTKSNTGSPKLFHCRRITY